MTTGVKRRNVRRVALLAVAAVTALATAAGCGSDDGGSSGGTVTIKLFTQTPQGGEGPYPPMAKKFEAANPNIKVQITTAGAEYPNVLRTQLQGGAGPDVFYVTAGSGFTHAVLNLAEAKQVKSVTDKPWAVAAVPANAKPLFTLDGQQYGMPVDLVPVTEVVNLTAYKEIGVSPATALDELYGQCATATGKNKSLLSLAGTVPQNLGLHAMQIAASSVYGPEPTWNDKRKAKQVTFAGTPGWKQALETIQTLKQRGCYQKGVEGADFGSMGQALAAGRTLGIFAPGGAATDTKKVNPASDFGVTVFPAANPADTRLSITPSNALAVNAKTKQADAAFKFLEFLAQPENQIEFAKLSGNISIDKSRTTPETMAGIKPFLADESKQVPLGNSAWPSGAVFNALGTGVQGLLTGQTNPDAILKAMDQAWDKG